MNNIYKFIKSFLSSDMAIDLGSENTTIYIKNKGIVLNEPTMIAAKYKYGHRSFIETGNNAKKLVGRSPTNIEVLYPIRKGVIRDLSATEEMLDSFISSIYGDVFFKPSPTVLVAIPSSSSDVEKRAVQDAIYNAGAKEVLFVKKGIAGAIGCGVDISSNNPTCIIDMGGDTTEISVIASSGIISSKTFNIGGRNITSSIQEYILEKYLVEIGFENAEKLKRRLATVLSSEVNSNETFVIKGKDGMTSKPVTIEVTQRDIYLGIFEPVLNIINAIDGIFKELPTETVCTLFQNGVKLIGGGSKIKGLSDLLSSSLNLKVEHVLSAEKSVIVGCGIILDQSVFYYEHDS